MNLTTKILYYTKDPTVPSPFPNGGQLPAMTTLLYRVCDNNPSKFEEATRLVELFITEALKLALPTTPPPKAQSPLINTH